MGIPQGQTTVFRADQRNRGLSPISHEVHLEAGRLSTDACVEVLVQALG